jgi:hypothetical protein
MCVLLPLFSNCAGQSAESASNLASATRTCVPGPGATGSPKTIEQAVELINSLPKPVTVPCFLESLDRPLNIYGTYSVSSAQPSGGPDNPRFFLFVNNLIISVTPQGSGRNMMEFGLLTSGTTTQKGELQFPIYANIVTSLPFDRIRYGSGTACSFCHGYESAGPSPNSFVSNALRPNPAFKVPLTSMWQLFQSCDPNIDKYRCEMFQGLFGFGTVNGKEFPSTIPIF